MPLNPPVLVTRAHVGKGPGIILVSFSAPAGDLGKGAVSNVEVIRIAMTHSTLREIAVLFNVTIAEIDRGESASQPDHANERFERGTRPRSVSEKN